MQHAESGLQSACLHELHSGNMLYVTLWLTLQQCPDLMYQASPKIFLVLEHRAYRNKASRNTADVMVPKSHHLHLHE